MTTRGPDGHGQWFSEDGSVGLVHRRLAILDLSASGAQPMTIPEIDVHIVFNGEIYNFLALRAMLESKGYVFRSRSDTEVLLHLYREYGREMVIHLRGMFAFALWDQRARGMLLARDPFGIKPLYFSDDGSCLRVASQVKALLAAGDVDTSPAPAGHVGFFIWGHVPEPWTLYRGIRALPAGTTLWVTQDGKRAEPLAYFDLNAELRGAESHRESLTAAETQKRLCLAVADSVAHHMVADVPVGVFLSAGRDSTAIAALAAEHSGAPLRTVTLGFPEYVSSSDDEVPLAEAFAEQCGFDHVTRWVQPGEFACAWDEFATAMDQPTVDGINSYLVSRVAREAGLKVALSGLGGDELLGGYSTFRDLPRLVRGARPFSPLGKAFRVVSGAVLSRFTSPKYASLFEYGGSYGGAYLLRRGLYLPWELPKILDADLVREGWRELRCLSRLDGTASGIDSSRLRISALEAGWYMRNQLLRDADWASMAHSLEVRVPFVDVNLWREVNKLVVAGYSPEKADVTRCLPQQLPAEIHARPKTGFSVPVREWFPHQTTGAARGLRGWAQTVYRAATNP